MGDLFKQSGSHKLDVTWMLSEDQISKLRTHDSAGTRCDLLSKRFGHGAWQLEFTSLEQNRDRPAMYLHAHPQLEDVQTSSSTRSWKGKGHFEWEISLVCKEVPANIEQKQMKLDDEFDSKTFSWGADLQITVKQILEIFDQQKSFGFRCILNGNEFPQQSLAAYELGLKVFDSSSSGDTVLVVHQSEGPPLHIFACKKILVSASSHFKTLFSSGFSESNSRKRLDIEKLATHEDDEGTSTSTLINEQLLPFLPLIQTEESTPQAPQDEARVTNYVELSPSSEPSRKSIKLEEEVEENLSQAGDGKLLNVVDIHEIDFRTYRAMIRYLHIPTAPFLPLSSNYLVEKSKNQDLETPPSDWLEDKFKRMKNQLDWEVKPCSSHSMYRLADLYDLEDLRELSLGFIVRSLSIENVAYELVSSLSLDYEAVQKPILEFFVKNWLEVRKTHAFKAVLKQFSLGKLAKGAGLMEKIFEMASLS